MPRLYWLVLGCVLLAVSGCDVVAEEQTILLTDTEMSFDYRFQGSDLPSAGTHTLTSRNTVTLNLADILEHNGFTLQDLRAVTVDRARVDLLFPTNSTLDFLDRIEISVLADQLSPALVAERGSIPDGQGDIAVSSSATRDIQAYVRSPTRCRLHLETDQAPADSEHEMEVTLELAIEVGGL